MSQEETINFHSRSGLDTFTTNYLIQRLAREDISKSVIYLEVAL